LQFLAIAQTPVRHGEFVVIGHVKIESDAVILQANELVARENVHVRLK